MATLRTAVLPLLRALPGVLQDGWRLLFVTPGSSLGMVLMLAVGITAATTVFSVVDAVVLRPLPFDASEEAASIEYREPHGPTAHITSIAPSQFLAFRESINSLESLSAVQRTSLAVDGIALDAPLTIARVSSGFFDLLRSDPRSAAFPATSQGAQERR